MTEPTEPWAPEGVEKLGTAPSRDGEGERGTSAYDGDGASDERGPDLGVDYYESPNTRPVGTGAREHQRESASKES
jgi:hypothetical protein